MDPHEPDFEQLDERLAQIEDQLDRVTRALRLVVEQNDARWNALDADLTARVRKASLDTFTAMNAKVEAAPPSRPRLPGAAITVIAVAAALLAAFALRGRFAADTTAAAAVPTSTPTQAAERRPEPPHDPAARAEAIDEVLAASDLARFSLTGAGSAAGALGQLRWSRSRGVVFTGSGLPAPPADMAYQLWLITTAGAVNAGILIPDRSGRVTLVADPMPDAPPVTGVRVTLEPAGGSSEPTGAVALTAR